MDMFQKSFLDRNEVKGMMLPEKCHKLEVLLTRLVDEIWRSLVHCAGVYPQMGVATKQPDLGVLS